MIPVLPGDPDIGGTTGRDGMNEAGRTRGLAWAATVRVRWDKLAGLVAMACSALVVGWLVWSLAEALREAL